MHIAQQNNKFLAQNNNLLKLFDFLKNQNQKSNIRLKVLLYAKPV